MSDRDFSSVSDLDLQKDAIRARSEVKYFGDYPAGEHFKQDLLKIEGEAERRGIDISGSVGDNIFPFPGSKITWNEFWEVNHASMYYKDIEDQGVPYPNHITQPYMKPDGTFVLQVLRTYSEFTQYWPLPPPRKELDIFAASKVYEKALNGQIYIAGVRNTFGPYALVEFDRSWKPIDILFTEDGPKNQDLSDTIDGFANEMKNHALENSQ